MTSDLIIMLAMWLCVVVAFVPRRHAHRVFAGVVALCLLWVLLAANSIAPALSKAEGTMGVIERAMKRLQQM
ncbi:MAG: hypothetical protein DSY80_07145 [Desulfocapsa sp.]|nr:MAG: hypothetical protein DSY80_07145 [Desulfocapsa sp.]